MRSSADRLSQLGVDQFLKGLIHQVTEQEPDLVTAKLRDELSQSGIMALGHRVSPFESTADELAEDSTVAPSDHESTYTTRWDAYRSVWNSGNSLDTCHYKNVNYGGARFHTA